MEEITYCPNCGGNTADPKYAKKFNQASSLDWTGKILCPVCNYFGFFLEVPKKEYPKLKFKPKKFPKRPLPTSSFGPGPEFWLVGVIAFCLIMGFIYILLTLLK